MSADKADANNNFGVVIQGDYQHFLKNILTQDEILSSNHKFSILSY